MSRRQPRAIGPGLFGAFFGTAISPHDPDVIITGTDMGWGFMTTDGGATWTLLGGSDRDRNVNPAYRGMWAVHFDPKRDRRIFIGSEHGIYRSTNRGRTWQMVWGGDAKYTTSVITCDPGSSDIVWAANGRGVRHGVTWSAGLVVKSTDGGDTWSEVDLGFAADDSAVRNWVSIVVDPQSTFVPGTDPGCGYQRIYLCGQGGFLVSEDGGLSWSSLEDTLPGGAVEGFADKGYYLSGVSQILLMPSDTEAHSTLWATIQFRPDESTAEGFVGGVWVSTDKGLTWTASNSGLETWLEYLLEADYENRGYSAIAGSRRHPDVLYWAVVYGIFGSTDGGASWTKLNELGSDWQGKDNPECFWTLPTAARNYDQSYYNDYGPTHALEVHGPDPQAVAYTDNATLGLSRDGGTSWTEPLFDYGDKYTDMPSACPVDPTRPDNRLTHKVRSRGVQVIAPFDVAVDPFDDQTIAACYADIGLVISRDGGEWWEWAHEAIVRQETNYIRAVLYDPSQQGRMFAGGGGWGTDGHVYESLDGGVTFTEIGIPDLVTKASAARAGGTDVNYYVHALALGKTGNDVSLSAGTDVGLYRTTDGGVSWELSDLGTGQTPVVRIVATHALDPERIYASADLPDDPDAQGLYRSTDGGLTWEQVGADVAVPGEAEAGVGKVRCLSLHSVTGDLLVLANQKGTSGWSDTSYLWKSTDTGDSFTRVDAEQSHIAAMSPTDANRLYLVTFPGGDFRQGTSRLLASTDGGANWTDMAKRIPFCASKERDKLVFDVTDSRRLFVVQDVGIVELFDRA